MEHVLAWDENKVTKWIATIGYGCYENQFREQGITGDVLVHLDHESLRDLSVLTVGQRMDLLKNIFQLKMHYKVPVNEWDYIPPSVLYETDWLGQNGMADYRKIEAAFQERDARIKRLTEEIHKMSSEVNLLKDEMNQILKWKSQVEHNSSSHKVSPSPKSQYYHHHVVKGTTLSDEAPLKPNANTNLNTNDTGAIKVYGDKISRTEHRGNSNNSNSANTNTGIGVSSSSNNNNNEAESSKNVRLLLDDPTSKVIMSALKKYNVVSDWQQYALWIQYGSPDNVQERALGYDERPLRISQKLKEAKQNPVFVLKHVKDNKPFIPPSTSNTTTAISTATGISSSTSSSAAQNTNTGHGQHTRSAPPPKHSQQQQIQSHPQHYSTGNLNTATTNKNITSGKVGYEVVIPVMSSTSLNNNNNAGTSNSNSSSENTKRSQASPTTQPLPTIYNNELGLDNAVVNAIFSINNSSD